MPLAGEKLTAVDTGCWIVAYLHNHCQCQHQTLAMSIILDTTTNSILYRPNHRGEDMWRRDDLPPFVAPPEGTREADDEKER